MDNNFNEKRKKGNYIMTAIFVSMIVVVFVFIFAAYLNGKKVKNYNHEYLVNDVNHTATNLERAIRAGQDNIKILSEFVGDSLDSDEVRIDEYQKLIQNSLFDFVEYVDANGMDHDITGGTIDASDRQYYQDSMNGNSGMEVIFDSRATNENLLMFYSPVYRDGRILGALIGVYEGAGKISGLLDMDYFGEKAVAYLCTGDGRIFASNAELEKGLKSTIFEVIDTDESNRTIISRAFGTGVNVSFNIHNNQSSGYVKHIEGTEWVLIQTYPTMANIQMVNDSNRLMITLIFVLILVFVATMYVAYNYQTKNEKEIEKALNETKHAQQEEEKQLIILQSMADIYYSMHLIDLETNTAIEYEAKNQVKDIYASSTGEKASDIMVKVMYSTMSDAYLESGLTFSDVNTLQERMIGKKFIAMDLQGKNVGWIRMSFITIEKDKNGLPIKVICTTQIVDDEKKREEQLLRNSNMDELTGCFNRRAYEEDLIYYPSVPTEENFVYIAMDINGLKAVNDTLGHEAGDELILGAVACMKQCLGNYGKIYRTGGDEFVAMIFADGQKLEAIKKDFEEQQLCWKSENIDELAISSGYVTKVEFPNKTVVEMAKIADKRMYDVKAHYYANRGVDRRGLSEAYNAICAMYTKILKINLTSDSHRIVIMENNEQIVEKGFSNKLSEWLKDFAMTGQVCEEDREEYLKKTDLDFMREHFRKGNKSLAVVYKRMLNGEPRNAMMDIIVAKDYTHEDQNLFLYVKSLD